MDKMIVLPDWVHMISLIGCDNNGKRSEWYVPTDLKDLNSDYVSKHFGNLQEDAYQRGQIELIVAIRSLISHDDSSEWKKMGFKFNSSTWSDRLLEILKNYKPSEIIEKVVAYNKINVGDVVKTQKGVIFIVTKIIQGNLLAGLTDNGSQCIFEMDRVTKTGKHFDIDEILKKIGEEEDFPF